MTTLITAAKETNIPCDSDKPTGNELFLCGKYGYLEIIVNNISVKIVLN